MAHASRVRFASLLIALLTIAGCARAVAVGSDPGPAYDLTVTNSLSEDMIVSYDTGAGPAVLGTVRAGGTERFVIASQTATSITVTARSADGERTAGPYTVQLQAGATPEVTLR
ncbi:MAG: hypothetical protein ACREM1_23580 [Longimicrobiales bacterium]